MRWTSILLLWTLTYVIDLYLIVIDMDICDGPLSYCYGHWHMRWTFILLLLTWTYEMDLYLILLTLTYEMDLYLIADMDI